MADITIDELREGLGKSKEYIIIDVREQYEHTEYNIGGKNQPLGEIHNWLAEYNSHKDDEIVVYCRTGQRSGMAAAFMKSQGFSNARNLIGGVVAWQQSENQ